MPRAGLDFMWSETLAMLARAERQQREVFQLTETGWEPPVDVIETAAGLVIIVALPGVRSDEMEIVVGNGELTVRGIRRWPSGQESARVHRIELPHGRFQRRLPLPPGNFEFVGQDHRDGCLLLTLKRLG